ncbi:T9SS type A sorting domain-containing protein [Winogradskyella sediminis]|uniref:T9SS type A sorting domain-containing protein n=1 Tax=Winogradskyella sediminis TaxID=1382466 RepID=UPI000E244193|nr:T9SS type A sorting domain-containing protein [Winogradskyella sediminis]REG85946.1 putative secreted protein (Por secretion system target) [Winogradskyella sediminis]
MKKITLLFLMCVALTWQTTAQIQVGDGENQFQAMPIDPYFGYSYTQSIYLANELNSGAGTITSLQYYFSGTGSIDNSQDLTIYVGHTSKTSFSDTDDWIDVTTLTESYAGGIPVTEAGWVTLTLDTPFAYNGTDNIVIAFRENGDGYDSSGSDFWNTATLEARSIYYRNDDNPITISDPETANGTANYVPTVIIDGITSLCSPAAATVISVDDCDNSQFSILVDVTDLGDSTNLEITNDAGVASSMVTETGEVTVGPFPIGTPVVLTLENENNDVCDVMLDSVLDFCPTATTTLDYYNLQWPATLAFPENETEDQMVYAQAYEAGLTDTTVGEAAAGIEVWIGYSDTDTDPSSEDWTWEIATFFGENGNNDEYLFNMQSLGLEEGTYYYASRFSLNEGPYMYGGILADGSNGGVWDGTTNISGVLTVSERLSVPGDDCANPIVIGTLPYNTTDDTINYSNAFGNGDSSCNSYYLSGNDVVYTYTPSEDKNINFELSNLTESWTAIHVLDSCPTDEEATCVAFSGNTGSTDRVIENIDVLNGTTYYIVVSIWASPDSFGYTLDITENSCTNATATYSVVSDCDVSGGFNIEVDITDMGTASNITVTDDQGSDAQVATEATTLTFGPYVNETDVVITITDDNDATCTLESDVLTQIACPPANNDCANSISITQETEIADEASATATPGSILGATASGLEAESCGTWTGTANDDVWYSFEALTENVNIAYELSTGFDGVAVLYSGTCGALTVVDCSDSGTTEIIEASGLTVGETYYTRIFQYGTGSTVDRTFDLKIWSPDEALSVNNFETEAAFTYYPNPVKNTLSLNAQNTIEQVTMYNMLGQEVLRATPNTVDSDLDMSNLQTGTYFVKVTIANVTKTIRVIKQ